MPKGTREQEKKRRQKEKERRLSEGDKLLQEPHPGWEAAQLREMADLLEQFLDISGGRVETSTRIYQGCLSARRFVCDLIAFCKPELYYACGYHRPDMFSDFSRVCEDRFAQLSRLANPGGKYPLLRVLLDECKKARKLHRESKREVRRKVSAARFEPF